MPLAEFGLRAICLAVHALLVAGATETWAAWPANGVPVGSTGMIQEQDQSFVAPDGSGGAFVTWREQRLNTQTVEDVYLQHVLSDGQLHPNWPVSGLPVVVQPNPQSPSGLIPDGAGGVIVVWLDARHNSNDIFALRVTSAGQRAAGWGLDGIPICTAFGDQVRTTVCPDGNGGAYIAWDDYRDGTMRARMTHILGDGTTAQGWETDGSLVTDYPGVSGVRVLLEKTDGCLIVWGDGRGQTALGVNIFATRITSAGERYPGWSAGGTPLLGSGTAVVSWHGVSDGQGGAFIGWNDNRAGISPPNPFYFDIYAQHVLSDGTLDARWAPDGIPVCNAPDGQFEFGMAADGSGGMLFHWEDDRQGFWQVYGQRLLEDGSVASGWIANGKPLVTSQVTKFQPTIVSDLSGGFYGFWVEYPANQIGPIVGQHMLGDGTMAWGSAGMPIATGGVDNPSVASDGSGGALMSYERFEADPWTRIYALRIAKDGPVPALLSLADYNVQPGHVTLRWQANDAASLQAAVERSVDGEAWTTLGTPRLEGMDLLVYDDRSVTPGSFSYRLRYIQGSTERVSESVRVEVPAVVSLALEGFRPNPALETAAISFSLPDARPASLQVHDVRGRVVFRREVGSMGPGSHLVRLDGLGKISPGIYWIRLVRAEGTLAAKGIVVR